jgi:hypothetical protein
MTKKIYKILALPLLALILVPTLTSAHQPRITQSRLTEVQNPEISKAYYGQLTGEPDIYVIKSAEALNLYVNVLVPDIAGQKKGYFSDYYQRRKNRKAAGGLGRY